MSRRCLSGRPAWAAGVSGWVRYLWSTHDSQVVAGDTGELTPGFGGGHVLPPGAAMPALCLRQPMLPAFPRDDATP